MQNYYSRSEKRQMRFEFRAEKGYYTSAETLYNNEARKLISNGFSVEKMEEPELKKGLALYCVSWAHPFGSYIPHEVEEYLKGKAEYPYEQIKTNAQSLYLLTAKAAI